MPFLLKDSDNNLIYAFSPAFHLEQYRLSKRGRFVEKAFQHGGDVIGDRKYELQHISLRGGVVGECVAQFEAACSEMKRAIHQDNLRLYGAYKDDQFFDIEILEDAEWGFITDGGIAEAIIHFLADPFRYEQDLTIVGPVDLTGVALCQTGLCVSVINMGDVEVSPVITYVCAGICQNNLRITNLTDDGKCFLYSGDLGCCDELVIDCANTTVLLNGADAIDNIDPSSSFYSLVGLAINYILVQVDGEVGLSNTIKHEFRQRYF